MFVDLLNILPMDSKNSWQSL